jgi:hypothetical protein
MHHRHLAHGDLALPAVDDIIRRGGWRDWVALRRAAVGDPAVRERIRRLCLAAELDPEAEGAQRLTFWRKYVQRLPATMG